MTNAQKEAKNASRFSLNHENQALLFESSWIFTRQPKNKKNLKKNCDSYDFLIQDPDFYWHGSTYFELTENLKSMPHPDRIARMIVDQLLLHSVKIDVMKVCSFLLTRVYFTLIFCMMILHLQLATCILDFHRQS